MAPQHHCAIFTLTQQKTDFLFRATNIKGTQSKFPINEYYYKADDEKNRPTKIVLCYQDGN
jgi:hypothetical protein